MKKTLKSVVMLAFCICMVMSTMIMASAVGKVTNAKATNVTYNSATLTWKKVSGADGYEVQQYKNKKWTTVKTISSGSTVSYKVSKLTTGTTYKYRVRAYDKKLLKTDYSAYVNINVKPLPVKVTGLKATSTGYNSVKLTWTKVAGATGYQVQQYKNKKWVNFKTTTANSLSVTGLTTNTAYSFRVRAYRTVSKTKHYSASYSATVKGTPKVPATSTITVSGETTTSVALNWKKVTGATGYQVYNPKTKKWVGTGTKLTYTLKSLAANTKYTAKVRAYRKSGGKTYYGTEKSISFVTLPAAVKNVKVSNITTSAVTVSWSKASNVAGYRVFLYDYSTKKETMLSDTTKTSVTLKNVVAGGKYKVAVRAYAKNTKTIYGAKTYVDNIYTPTQLTKGSGTNTTKIQVTWPKTPDATKYVLERYDSATNSWKTLVSSNVTSYTDAIGANMGGLYRVTSYKNSTVLKTAMTELSTTGITLAKSTNKMKVTWKKPSTSDAIKFYAVFEKPRKGSGKTDEEFVYAIDTKDTTESIFTAYGTEQTYVIYAVHGVYVTSPNRTKVAEFTVRAENLAIDSTDASKNGQILRLVDAINRTKYEQNKVSVTQKSTIAINVDKITMDDGLYAAMIAMAIIPGSGIKIEGFKKANGRYECTGTDNIVKFMNGIDDGATTAEEINTVSSINETVTFTSGNGYSTENSQYVYLKKYIEPSSADPYTAYLYNANDVSKWDEGFSSVSTTVLSNGNYSFTGTIKKEEFGTQTKSTATSANYHSGFTSSFDGLNFGGTEGMDNLKTTVGASKITAEYTPDGKLVSYNIGKTTISMAFETRMSKDMAMGMEMSGDCTFSYSFKR